MPNIILLYFAWMTLDGHRVWAGISILLPSAFQFYTYPIELPGQAFTQSLNAVISNFKKYLK